MHEKLDQKNIGLAKVIFRLRQDIDLYRIIGLNVIALKEHGVSPTFWGHVQALAQQSIALAICKIYEDEKRNDLNSIPGVISKLPEHRIADDQRSRFAKFAERYGIQSSSQTIRESLREVFSDVRSCHELTLSRLKVYRNKVGDHSEHGVQIATLPSIAE